MMVANNEFSSIFDYRSAFEYSPRNKSIKPFNRSKYKSAFSYHAVSISSEEEMVITADETWPSLLLRNIITFVLHFLVITLFPFSVWICVKRIHALERIVLMRLGKLQPIRGPGFAFILPCIDEWTRVDLRPQTFTVSTSQLTTADGGIIEAQTDVEYRVADVINYVMKLCKQEKTLKDLGLFCVRNIVSENYQDDLERNTERVNWRLKDDLNRTSINWGLEIINVTLHSVKVLKEAENAIGTIMTCLKAVLGQSSEHTAAMFPPIQQLTDGNVKLSNVEKATTLEPDVLPNGLDYVETISQLADSATQKGSLNDLTANFRFDIVGRSTKTVFCCVQNGSATVFEDTANSLDSDITLMLTEDNLKDFLSKRISPTQAYMDGKIMVSGDWSLLRSLARVFD